MRPSRSRLGRALSLLGFVTVGCAPGAAPPAARAPNPSIVAKPAAAIASSARVSTTSPPRPPPPVVTAAMAGEPAADVLADARLEPLGCEAQTELEERRIADEVRAMRDAIDAEYGAWVAEQPSCWAEYRRRDEESRRAYPFGESYGYGGLGLSGVGSGGGGVAYGRGAAGRLVVGSRPMAAGKATQYSSTNNQVAGVDEADLVKTDGRYLYLAMNGALRIVEALRPRVVSVTKLPGTARELFVEGARAVVYSSGAGSRKPCTYGYDCQFAGDGSSTRITVFDVSKPSAPRRVRELELSGSLMAARRIGQAIHTVVADGDSPRPSYETWPVELPWCGVREATVRARLATLKRENERKIRASRAALPTLTEDGQKTSLCRGLLRPKADDGHAFTSVVSFELGDDRSPVTTETIESRPGAVYASGDALYVAVTRSRGGRGRWFYSNASEVSAVHKFRIGERAGDTRYVGSGVVPGHVLNQFSMDEWYGYLRVATSKGRVPDPNVESELSILRESAGGALVRVGAISGLAPGEDIRAVRFDDDRGYVVTFKKTDPLFVLDLYDPARPTVLGELKIPGFSTYIHRLDPDHLLSIGFDADDHGDFAYFDGVILQLFDVKSPTEPKLLHKEKIGSRGSSSAAATDHLAFNYFPERGLLAIPMTICEGGGDGAYGDRLTFSGLLVYDVNVERGFERLGGIDHGRAGVSCSTWWSSANSAVERSVFIDELVYSIAGDRAKVQRLGHFGTDVADLPLTP